MSKLDNKLFTALCKLPPLRFYRRVAQDETKLIQLRQDFLNSGRPPIFSYPQVAKFDFEDYTKALNDFAEKLPALSDNEIMLDLYRQKISELRGRVDLLYSVAQKDGTRVTELSRQLFGEPLESTTELANEFRQMRQHHDRFVQHNKPITTEIFAEMVKQTLAHYKMERWQVEFHSGPSVKIVHGNSPRHPLVKIPKSLKVSRARATRLLTHEIEVHALRTENGFLSPLRILERGLDRYLATDEGLAIYFQSQLGRKSRLHAPGFWDAWTSALTLEGDFASTFATISQARSELAELTGHDNPEAVGQDAAWRLCVRAYRGIIDTSEPQVGFLRDHMYRSGLAMIKRALAEQGDEILPKLFVGNIGLHHLDEMEKLELEPGRTPELISKRIVDEVI